MGKVFRQMEKMIKRVYRKCYRTVFKPMYYLLFHHRVIKRLKSYGISEVKVFNDMKTWYKGHYRSPLTGRRLVRFFYSAEYNGKVCFVKIGLDGETEKEILALEFMNEQGFTFVPSLLLSDLNFAKNTALMVTEYIPDLMKINITDDKAAFNALCTEFEYIHKQMREHQIIHGDLNINNLLMTKDNRLTAIDFGIAFSPHFETFQFNIPFIGAHFAVSENKCIYDNAHSFLCILRESRIPSSFMQEDCYKRIQQLVGLHTHVINIPENG